MTDENRASKVTPTFRQGYAAGIRQAATCAAKNGSRAIARCIREYLPEGEPEQALDYPRVQITAGAHVYEYGEITAEHGDHVSVRMEDTVLVPRAFVRPAPRSDSAPTQTAKGPQR